MAATLAELQEQLIAHAHLSTLAEEADRPRTELPRDYMARCASFDRRGIFEYRADLIAGHEHMRFVGAQFYTADDARRWDQRPCHFMHSHVFVTWGEALVWMRESESDE